MDDIATKIIEGLKAPAFYLIDPSRRIYWGYLLTSLVIAILVAIIRNPKPLNEFIRDLTSLQRWKNPSILLDIKLLIINSLLRALLIAPIIIPIGTVTVFTTAIMEKMLGAPSEHHWSSFEIGVAYTLTLFIFSDLSRYIVHRCFHEIPFLWQFHQVHHSATDLTPMTLYRLHPIEIVALEIRRSLAVGLTSGFFLFWFRGDLNSFDMLGINAFGFIFNLTGANLRHSQTWLSYGRFIEQIFISPAQHQIHHSSASIHWNKNYGSCLAIWDWIGKSLVLAGKREKLTYGIPGQSREVHPTVASALFAPFRRSLRLIPFRKEKTRGKKQVA